MNTKINNVLAIFGRLSRQVPAVWLGVLLVAVVGCDSSGGVRATDDLDDSSESYALLTADLGLSSEDATSIASKMDGFGATSVDAPDPGFLWELAAEIHASLSEEQLDRLMARIEAADGGFARGPGGGMRRGGGQGQGSGMRPGGNNGPGGFGAERPGAMRALSLIDLTDEQKAEILAIHESHRDDVRALLGQRGSLDADAFREQMDALRESIRAEVEAVLTDEQVQQLEELKVAAEERRAERQALRETRREESRAVMADVLGLTDAQLAELDALRSDRDERREAIQELFDSGADRDDVRAFIQAERDERREAVMEIVDERQYEIMQIHALLSQRFAARRAAGRRGGGGPNGPGGQGHGSGLGFGSGQGFGQGSGFGVGSGAQKAG